MDLRIRIPPDDRICIAKNIVEWLRTNKTESIETILQGIFHEYPGIIDELHERQAYILHKAIRYNNFFGTKCILKHCTTSKWINAKDTKSMTPIRYAIETKNYEIIDLLFSHEASLSDKQTLLEFIRMDI